MHRRLIGHDLPVGESKEVADRTLDARVLLVIPPHADDHGPLINRLLDRGEPDMSDRARPLNVAQLHFLSRLDRPGRSRLRPTPKRLACWPPTPGAPVGFSNEMERETRPVSSTYGWWIRSGCCALIATDQTQVIQKTELTVARRRVASRRIGCVIMSPYLPSM